MSLRRTSYVATFLSLLLVSWSPALAHGGVSKNIGHAVVYLNQEPLSPLVGERVKFSFALQDTKGAALVNLPVQLTLTDTYYGDESKDKVILTQPVISDVNGDFEFAYTFTKQNYFDLDLDFADPITKATLNTGFLVQPRTAPPGAPATAPLPLVAGAIVLGVLLTLGVKTLVKRLF